MDKFANLPGPMKWVIGVGGVGTLFAAGWFGSRGGWKMLLIFAAILILLLVVIVGGFWLWNLLKRKKQNARLRGELQQSTTAAPRGMSPTDLAKLDSLRKKFEEGVEAFRSRGKDLYTLPWYVIIGEPGSGKTEAVRHCNVGFPPGMHEGDNDTGYMGAGGTINMNWWFTNFAVLLDTAGRLVFEDVKPGETSEWKEFLKLLKKNRPNCPINGLLLVIPSDSLIKDSADDIGAKAGKIAQQLDVIQRVLDFRFPVYVAITKSDKINGFREFFESVTDPQLQHQMMGWSNPEPLDSPFKPDLVDKHLTQVSERLRRRRLGLIRDPVPEHATKRIDEVDSLFALPNSLLMLAPRLRRYLETIFMPGEWSAKPLFLRGIYFTSSMREGAALDQELAEAIGVAADELPEGKVWERDRAYFLRDLFMEKVFKEKGLVTRATNTRAMLRRRQMFLYGASFVALTIFVVVAWLGMRTVRGQVGDRASYWSAAAQTGWKDKRWNRPLFRLEDENYLLNDGGGFVLATNQMVFSKEFAKLTPGEFQQKLREWAEKELKSNWLLPGFAGGYNANSKKAQRVIFETGVLQPLLEGVGHRIREAKVDSPQPYLPDALVTLVRLESEIRSRGKTETTLDSRAAANFLGALQRCATGTDAALDTNLVPVMVWTYSNNPGAWPPAWLSATVTNKEGRATNPIIMSGLDVFVRGATNTVQVMASNWLGVDKLITSLAEFGKAEGDLAVAVASGKEQRELFAKVAAARESIDSQIKQCSTSELFTNGVSLTNAYANFTNNVTRFAVGAFTKVEAENELGLKHSPGFRVFEDIRNYLRNERVRVTGRVSALVPPDVWGRLVRSDECYLGRISGAFLYERRGDIYSTASLIGDPALFAGTGRAELMKKLEAWDDSRKKLAQFSSDYKGCSQEEVRKVADFYRERAARTQAGVFLGAYQQAAAKEVAEHLGFPVLRGATKVLPAASLEQCERFVEQISGDLSTIKSKQLGENKEWEGYAARAADLVKVVKTIKGGDKLNYCTISLLPYENADGWRRTYRGIKLSTGDATSEIVDTSNSEDAKMGKIDPRKPCTFLLYKDKQSPETTPLVVGEKSDWGPLQLVTRFSEKPGLDGSWIVTMPAPEAGGGNLRLKLSFDQPLPDLEHWPKEW